MGVLLHFCFKLLHLLHDVQLFLGHCRDLNLIVMCFLTTITCYSHGLATTQEAVGAGAMGGWGV